MAKKKNEDVVEQGSQQSTELQSVNENKQVELKSESDKKAELLLQLEKFTTNLNRAPNPQKIAKHEGYDYIPISVVEKDLMKMFFGLVQFEIVSFQQILNEFVVHARIKVFHPVLEQWLNYDGIGAGMFQQKANTPIQDFFQYKLKNAGKITVPNAYAEAIKNGAKKIGKRFGSDLNRKFEDNYQGFFKEQEAKEQESEILNK